MTEELTPDQLRRTSPVDDYNFDTTKEIEPLEEIIGQERAIDAIKLGLGVKDQKNRYNIYVAGEPGTGKMSAVNQFLERASEKEETPPDLCYVHNFDDPYSPQYLRFPAGKGKEFRSDMEELIDHLKEGVSDTFESGQYNERKQAIDQQFNKQKKELFQELEEEVESRGFLLQRTPFGINTIPKDEDGEPLDQDEFQNLPDEKREELESRQEELQSMVQETMEKVMEVDEQRNEAIQELNKEAISFFLEPMMRKLREKYEGNEKVVRHLANIEEDILDNIDEFTDDTGGQNMPAMVAQVGDQGDKFKKYRANVVVDNEEVIGAPVVVQENATYPNLFGAVEKKAQFGMMSTDFTMIRSGALHQANGGYLVVKANNLFRYGISWEGLKVALNCGEIRIENPAQMMGYSSAKGLQPEPVPLDVKVVIVGNRRIYQLLNKFEDDFQKLFNIKSDFDYEMDWEEGTDQDMAQFISGQAEENEQIKHFDRSGVGKIVEYSSEQASDQEKLSTKFSDTLELIKEASYWAEDQDRRFVSAEDVDKAIDKRIDRKSLVRDKIRELIERRKILVDTEGQKIGQISGLSVLDTGDFRFGRPSRITANVYAGKEGVVNIDREADLSGSAHTKGIMILKGFLGDKFAYDKPLSLTTNITFEQTYSQVDGDSASSTELYAILSSLADLPLDQGIAVTGSVNQKGEIQPIGGVNEKIEGYYYVCQERGLTGDQGVIIPDKNVDNLMFDEEVLEAVRNDQFHIYSVDTVSDGIEILTDVPAGSREDMEGYEEDTVFGRADQRLRDIRAALNSEGNSDQEN